MPLSCSITLAESHKQIEAIAREVMCYWIGKNNVDNEVSMKDCIKKNLELASDLLNFLSAVQQKVEQYIGIKLDNIIGEMAMVSSQLCYF